MAKRSGKPHRRAYVNPEAGFPEAEQRAEIEAVYDDIAEWYVESRSVTRADFIEHLRPGDEAIVARAGCLAKVAKDWRTRDADLKDARGDIHAQCAVLISANDGLRSDKHWPAMKAAAKAFFLWAKNVANGSRRKLPYTNAECTTMAIVMANKKYKNDDERFAAIAAKKIKLPSRTWLYGTLPLELIRRGISI